MCVSEAFSVFRRGAGLTAPPGMRIMPVTGRPAPCRAGSGKERPHMDSRTSKQNYYLDIADSVLERSTCLRRKYGAIIVRNDEIISTGYNGAPRGRRNCSDLGVCTRETLKIPSGERYELCRSVHAEANAIISASRRDMIGATIYLVGRDARTNELLSDAMSCSMCKRQIINAGIEKIVIRTSKTEYRTIPVSDWIENDDSIFML
jgi:dCMP deaminase